MRPPTATQSPASAGRPSGPERSARAPRASGSGEISKGRAGAGAAALPALVRSSTPRSPMSQLPLYLTPRPGRAAPLVRDLHRAQPALARQPAQGAARVPGRRRHGWHVRCMSFTGFWLYRPERRWLSSPPGLCHPSASSVGPRQKNRGETQRELRSSNARACPELHLACRASHHHHQPSRLLCAQGSETSTPHSTWAREKVRQRTLPSHTRPTHQELSLHSH